MVEHSNSVGYFVRASEGKPVGSLLLSERIAYEELGLKSCRVIVWWGFETEAVPPHQSQKMKEMWLSKINSLVDENDNLVALVHHANPRGRRFAEKMGFEIEGVSIRWEGK